MTEILLACLLACFASFAWSVSGVFAKPVSQDVRAYNILKLMSISAWVLSVYSVITTSTIRPICFFIALSLSLISLCLFWYAKFVISKYKFDLVFSNDDIDTLVCDGPFKYTRHPFYLSYILAYLAVFVFSLDYLSFVVMVAMYCLYWFASLREEKKMLRGRFSEQYIHYMHKTPSIFLRIKK